MSMLKVQPFCPLIEFKVFPSFSLQPTHTYVSTIGCSLYFSYQPASANVHYSQCSSGLVFHLILVNGAFHLVGSGTKQKRTLPTCWTIYSKLQTYRVFLGSELFQQTDGISPGKPHELQFLSRKLTTPNLKSMRELPKTSNSQQKLQLN